VALDGARAGGDGAGRGVGGRQCMALGMGVCLGTLSRLRSASAAGGL